MPFSQEAGGGVARGNCQGEVQRGTPPPISPRACPTYLDGMAWVAWQVEGRSRGASYVTAASSILPVRGSARSGLPLPAAPTETLG